MRTLSFSPNGKFLASGSFDTTIGIFLYKGGKFESLSPLEFHESEVEIQKFNI